jgi:molybdenum cofactor biosynthesis protein B
MDGGVDVGETVSSSDVANGVCRDGCCGILSAQLDYRTRLCNFVEIMPRLDERRPKAKGASA